MAESIQALSKNKLDSPLKLITITSENSSTTEIQHFIHNIKTEILKYDVILSSPSLGTGVDITFPDAKSEIDCVYGFFETRINTHTEIDQQLARVRHPKEVHVWVAGGRYNFETEFNVIKANYLHETANASIHDSYTLDKDADRGVRPFLNMAALIISFQRASKNRLKQHFIQYKKEQGCDVSEVLHDAVLSNEGKDFYNKGINILLEEEMNNVLTASLMTYDDMNDYLERRDSNDEQTTLKELHSFYRTKIENFYKIPVSKQLIKLDEKGLYRTKVTTFEAISDQVKIKKIATNKTAFLQGAPSVAKAQEKMLKNKDSGIILIHELLSQTPVFDKGVFNTTTTFCIADLQSFAKGSQTVKPFLETHLDLSVRKDLMTNPVRHLGDILKKVGLSTVKDRPHNENGKKTYYYKLSEDDLKAMKDIVQRRHDAMK